MHKLSPKSVSLRGIHSTAFKRMFGDHMHSRKWEHMVQEIRLRVAQYNKWLEAAGV